MSTDTLSSVLRAVRLTGAVFFDVHASAPWVAEAPPARWVAPKVLPGAEHVIEYHLVVSGACWGGLIGEPPLRLEAGDVIVFPQGDTHVMSSEPGMRAKPELELHDRPKDHQLPVLVNLGGKGDEVHVICGFLGCDATPFNPLLQTLPRVLCVRGGTTSGPFAHLIGFIMMESRLRRPGGECVLAKMSELLFIEAVRCHVDTLPPDHTGWLAGLRDPAVGRALALLHGRPAEDWSLDSLAQHVGMSRSLLAERFAHFVGTPPIQYLARWRMQLAAGMLTATNASVADVAGRVGYGSEAAFSRAFKRIVGVAPALWREGQREHTASSNAVE